MTERTPAARESCRCCSPSPRSSSSGRSCATSTRPTRSTRTGSATRALHLVWLLGFMLLSGLANLYLVWFRRPFDVRNLWLSAGWQCCNLGGFWIAVLLAPVYGGLVTVPGEHVHIFGWDENVLRVHGPLDADGGRAAPAPLAVVAEASRAIALRFRS